VNELASVGDFCPNPECEVYGKAAMKSIIRYGNITTLDKTGERTVYVECTNLASLHMNGRLVRKTLGFSKRVDMLTAACVWEDADYMRHQLRPPSISMLPA